MQAGKVPFQCVHPTQKQWLGLQSNAWSCARPAPELVCAISTGVNALPSWDVTPRLPRAEPAGHLCTPCTDTSVSCVWGGVTVPLQPGWFLFSWRINHSSSLLHFQCCLKWGASILLFLLLAECMSLLMLRCSQNRMKWQKSLSRAEKGKRQKETSAGECQAQWGLGKLPSSFLQFVKSLVDFSTTHSLYLINNT